VCPAGLSRQQRSRRQTTAITADHTGNAGHDQAIAGVLPVQGVAVQSLKRMTATARPSG